MSNGNKKSSNDKFKFVSIDEIDNESEIDKINIVDTPEVVVSYNEDSENSKTDKNNKKFNIYFGFTARVIIMIILIIFMFISACLLIRKVVEYNNSKKIYYNDVSKSSYQVCFENESLDDEENKCRSEGIKYERDKVKSIVSNFTYKIDFLENIDYKPSYHISTIVSIYTNNNRLIYKNEELLINKTDISNINNQNIQIDKTVNIDFQKYVKEVKSNVGKYANNYYSTLEIVLYLDGFSEKNTISFLTIPINEPVFSIKKYNTSNNNKSAIIKKNEWSKYTTFYTIIASLLVIISLVLIYKTTNLVLKVTSCRSAYQKKLSQIFRKYDRIIVIARDGYMSMEKKEIVKLFNFEQLLELNDKLNKPIIYSKVNDIKSEFIIEDDTKLYKFVLKEFE